MILRVTVALGVVVGPNVIGAPLDFISMVQIVLIGTLVSVGTALNVTGDLVGTSVIAHSEGEELQEVVSEETPARG